MALSLTVKANDFSKVDLYHPATHERLGTLHFAGPDHEATKAWRRDIQDRRQRRGYKEDGDAELIEGMSRRTVGWEGVKDSGTGEDVPFSKDALPALYSQEWLMKQVLTALGENDFFFKE